MPGVELNYFGPNHTGHELRHPARGVSQIPSARFVMHSCYEMDRDDIRELQGFYVAAAERAREAGFDLILIYGAETVPITQQFLMPYFNRRTDEYGGSFENRARFTREVLELVREAIGDDCALGMRFSIDTLSEDGLGIEVQEDGVRFIEHVDHLVDLWDVQVGPPSLLDTTDSVSASRVRPENWQKPWVEQIRPHTDKPIVGVGRFTNPDTMVAAIRSGQLDIIGAARPSIADPFLPKKIEEGRLDEIRECIGCNICIGRFKQGGARLVCTQNPTAGEEFRRGWHPERFTRARNHDNDVLVVGAGPAGMECAIVLAKRGMRRVHLVEAADDLGGAMRWISRLPGLGEWGRVIDYRRIQIQKLKNLEFIPGTRLDATAVAEYGAEIVVVATGSRWATDGLNGWTRDVVPGADASLPHCLTPEQIMVDGRQPPGEHVLVYDCEGYFMGASLAEKLVRDGQRVTLVTPHATVGPYMAFTTEAIYMHKTLSRLGVEMITDRVIRRIDPGAVAGGPLSDHTSTTVWDADSIVLITQRNSNDAIYRELRSDTRPARARGDRRPVPDRRLHRAAFDRRVHLRRAPARARDRLRKPSHPAHGDPREPRARLRSVADRIDGPGQLLLSVVLASWTEHAQVDGGLRSDRLRPVDGVRWDHEHRPGADDRLVLADNELQLAGQHVDDLLVRVRVWVGLVARFERRERQRRVVA